jgi:hypothetical protein
MTANALWHAGLGSPSRGAALPRPQRARAGYKIALALWLVVLFAPQWWVGTKFHVLLVTKLPLVGFALLGLATLLRFPKKIWIAPFLVMAAYVLLTFRFATNPAYAERPAKMIGLYYVMALGLSVFIKTPRQALPFIATMLGWQFTWWALLGDRNGMVAWHPDYANYDAYGPLMALGVAGSLNLGLALRSRKQKLIAFGTSMACVLGIVSAYQRGAALTLGVVLLFVWWRSPRKGIMSLGVIAALVAVILAATVFFAGDQRGTDTKATFFQEMMTISEEGGTRGDREVLWGAAITVWKQHPLLGVGGQSFGPFAAEFFQATSRVTTPQTRERCTTARCITSSCRLCASSASSAPRSCCGSLRTSGGGTGSCRARRQRGRGRRRAVPSTFMPWHLALSP